MVEAVLSHQGYQKVTQNEGQADRGKEPLCMLKISLIPQIHLVLAHYNSMGPISQLPCE